MQERTVVSWVAGENGVPLVTVAGEIDIATAPQLDRALFEACMQASSSVVVSLEQCTYCDSSGLSVLLRHARRMAHFIVVSPEESDVRRLLRISQLDRLFEVVSGYPFARGGSALRSTIPRTASSARSRYGRR